MGLEFESALSGFRAYAPSDKDKLPMNPDSSFLHLSL